MNWRQFQHGRAESRLHRAQRHPVEFADLPGCEPVEGGQEQHSPLVAGKASQRLPQQLRVHHLGLGPVLVWSPGLQGEEVFRVDRVKPPGGQHVDRHVRAMVSSHAATVPRRGS